MSDGAPTSRLLTGDRPTGPLHLGHLVGTLRSRVELQDAHECMFIVADLHTLTTRPEKAFVDALPQHVRDVVLDNLSVGVDPGKSTMYLQSGVPAVYDLAILLQMITPAARLSQIQTLHDMAQVAGVEDEAMSMGLLGYPVLQAADILMARAEVVPIGADNEAHVQIARELAARFNELYGEVFPIPEARVARVSSLPGVEGGKMSKSAGNAIWLKDPQDVVVAKLARMDGERLGAFVDAFIDDPGARDDLRARAGADELDPVRSALGEHLAATLDPIRARRASFANEEGLVDEILVDGTIRAREIAYKTLQEVREAMGLEGLWKGLVSATEKRAEARKKPY